MSDKEKFHVSGPSQLPSTIDWSSLCDQKSVAASLVRGAYVLELDRLQKRQGAEALAHPWWEGFGFKLSEVLEDNRSTIFGAVLVYDHLIQNQQYQPSCVVAFRGTNTKDIAGFIRDTNVNFCIGIHTLHETDRFERAREAVRGAVNAFGIDNVWIAGHSQGAATALLVGKDMAKGHGGGNPFPLKAFLFNPPFVGSTNRIGRSLVGVLVEVARTFRIDDGDDEAAFAACSCWHPHLFVHPKDFLCRGYIKYFERRRMPTAQYTLRGLLLGADSTHLIASAVLVVNHTLAPLAHWKKAHGIYQWWRPEIELRAHKYTFNLNQPFSTQEFPVS
ncbi:GDSL esterase/lipase At4g10955-like [Salvia hispanica]|uniref:GDSL esterase/lipase At4g10955-like n=1 Tax=Salvia hispanica TaxID=49212 RepID=UPI00200938E3|nr:GDSL esterase/lipase At4g10955-like [Salvia hispanica]XP_047983921.1 GDSL esterase/lipase At4g10955-like [Salvia hispanica]